MAESNFRWPSVQTPPLHTSYKFIHRKRSCDKDALGTDRKCQRTFLFPMVIGVGDGLSYVRRWTVQCFWGFYWVDALGLACTICTRNSSKFAVAEIVKVWLIECCLVPNLHGQLPGRYKWSSCLIWCIVWRERSKRRLSTNDYGRTSC